MEKIFRKINLIRLIHYNNSLTAEVINLGSDRPVKLNHVINLIEQCLGKKAQIEYQPHHPADVPKTWADITKAKELLGWQPKVSIEEGIQRTVEWYLENRECVKNVGSSLELALNAVKC